mgnify:CR=1 FL=1
MKLDSDISEIEVTSGLESLSRTLRVADVIRRRDLDFVRYYEEGASRLPQG